MRRSPLARSRHSAAEKNWNDAALESGFGSPKCRWVTVVVHGVTSVGQQLWLARERVDEGALAGLDLPDDGDAEHLLAKPIDGLADEGLSRRLDETCERSSAIEQLLLH